MRTRIVMEGNAFYEIDEECIKAKEQKEKRERAGDNKEKGQDSILLTRPVFRLLSEQIPAARFLVK